MPRVLAIIGWSGVGKTSLLECLIHVFKARGLRVGIIKHDGHDFQMDKPGKDTWRFTQAGADSVAIANASHAAILENRPVSLERLLGAMRDVDIVLAEGYDKEDIWQIEVHRKGFDTLRARNMHRLLAIVTDEPLQTKKQCFGFDEVDALADFILTREM